MKEVYILTYIYRDDDTTDNTDILDVFESHDDALVAMNVKKEELLGLYDTEDESVEIEESEDEFCVSQDYYERFDELKIITKEVRRKK